MRPALSVTAAGGACALLAAGLTVSAAGPRIDVPRGAPIAIDGTIDPTEWDGAVMQRLPDGTQLRLRHDGSHLFLAITATTQGFSSVCVVSRDDTVRVLHASAALGSLTYARDGESWRTRETEFVYGMRNTALTDQARAERSAYLSSHGWVASTSEMGGGFAQEVQIAVATLSTTPRLALGRFAMKDRSGDVHPWPASMRKDDGCANDKLVRGFVPRALAFEPAEWASLNLAK